MTERLSIEKALRPVRDSDDGLYGVLLENGSMELGYYKPADTDEQSPHKQDEIDFGSCQPALRLDATARA